METSPSTFLLKEAVIAINNLRRQNELMSARLEMFDTIKMMLHTQPAYPKEGHSPDLASDIEAFIQLQEKITKGAPDQKNPKYPPKQ